LGASTGLRFHTPNGLHVRRIDRAVARLLFRAGFHTLRLSFESVREDRQADSCFKAGPEDLHTAIEALRHEGYVRRQMEVYILCGLPGQDATEVEESLRFAHAVGGWVKLVQFSPVPGTRDFERAVAIEPALAREPLLHNNTVLAGARTIDYARLQSLKDLARSLNARSG